MSKQISPEEARAFEKDLRRQRKGSRFVRFIISGAVMAATAYAAWYFLIR